MVFEQGLVFAASNRSFDMGELSSNCVRILLLELASSTLKKTCFSPRTSGYLAKEDREAG
jgi:hypothetical protein